MPRGGEAGDVGHLASGDEGEARGGRKAEDVLEPGAGDFFDDGGGGARGMEAGGLVPGAREPVGGEGGGDGAADDPAEEARTGRADDAAFDVADKVADDLGGVDARVGEGTAEAGEQLVAGRGGVDRGAIERV